MVCEISNAISQLNTPRREPGQCVQINSLSQQQGWILWERDRCGFRYLNVKVTKAAFARRLTVGLKIPDVCLSRGRGILKRDRFIRLKDCGLNLVNYTVAINRGICHFQNNIYRIVTLDFFQFCNNMANFIILGHFGSILGCFGPFWDWCNYTANLGILGHLRLFLVILGHLRLFLFNFGPTWVCRINTSVFQYGSH